MSEESWVTLPPGLDMCVHTRVCVCVSEHAATDWIIPSQISYVETLPLNVLVFLFFFNFYWSIVDL